MNGPKLGLIFFKLNITLFLSFDFKGGEIWPGHEPWTLTGFMRFTHLCQQFSKHKIIRWIWFIWLRKQDCDKNLSYPCKCWVGNCSNDKKWLLHWCFVILSKKSEINITNPVSEYSHYYYYYYYSLAQKKRKYILGHNTVVKIVC